MAHGWAAVPADQAVCAVEHQGSDEDTAYHAASPRAQSPPGGVRIPTGSSVCDLAAWRTDNHKKGMG